MARGWESKSVEAQQAEANQKAGKPRKRMTAAEAALQREEQSLQLSRQRVLQQLEAASNERHKASLQAALADLDQKLHRLKSES